MADSELMGAGKGALGGAATGAAFGPWGAVVGAAIGGVAGWLKAKKARKTLAEAQFDAVPKDVLETQRMAREMSKQGMPSDMYKQAEQNIQRNTNAALAAAQDRRGGLMSVGKLNQQANDATLSLDVENSRQRRQNIQYLGQVNNIVGAYKQKRGERDWDYAMQLIGANNQNNDNRMQSGLSVAYGLQQTGRLNNWFGGGGGDGAIGGGQMMSVDAPVGVGGRSPVVGGGYIDPSMGQIGNRYSYVNG